MALKVPTHGQDCSSPAPAPGWMGPDSPRSLDTVSSLGHCWPPPLQGQGWGWLPPIPQDLSQELEEKRTGDWLGWERSLASITGPLPGGWGE